MTATPIFNATVVATCTCRDRKAAQVAQLMTEGIDQWTASGLVYRRHLPDNADATVRRAWVRLVVGDLFKPLRERWGL